LQDLAPNTKAQAEFTQLFGKGTGLRVAGTVPWAWRERNVLVPAIMELQGPLVDLDDMNVIRQLRNALAGLLARLGIQHLDISTLRSIERTVTQHVSRTLYDQGAAGLCFRSNRDDQPCFVLFEGRGTLEQSGATEPCTDDIPEFLQVCSEFSLIPERKHVSAHVVRGDTRFAFVDRVRQLVRRR